MSARLLVPVSLVVLAGCAEEPSGKTFREAGGGKPQPVRMVQGADKAQADVPRRIIYTATIDLAVEDLDPVTAKAREMVAGFGGYISKAETTGRAEYRRTATLTVRVPVAKFPEAVEEFSKLGVVTKTSTDSQDVTEEFIDVEARLKNYKAEEVALNKLLESAAGKLEDVLKIREQVIRNRAEIERIEGRLKYLTSQTDLSTITLSVREEKEFTPMAVRTFGTRVGDQFRWSLGQIQLFGENLVLATVAALPWLPGVLVVGWIIRRWRRRSRVTPRSTPSTAPTAGGPSDRTAAASP